MNQAGISGNCLNIFCWISLVVILYGILIFDSSGKQVIHGLFVLYHVIVVVVDNTIRCNHDEV